VGDKKKPGTALKNKHQRGLGEGDSSLHYGSHLNVRPFGVMKTSEKGNVFFIMKERCTIKSSRKMGGGEFQREVST